MFETTTAYRTRRRGYLILPVSFVLHAAAAGGFVFASVWTVDLPRSTPSQMQAFQVQAVPKVPPAAPPRGRREPATEPSQTPVRPAQDVAPQAIPDAVPQPVAAPADPDGDPNGVDGGIPGGEPGGVVDAGLVPDIDALPVEPERTYVPGGDVKAPVLISAPPPVYPRPAIASRVEGEVVVSCIIDTSGSVRDVRVVRSAHFLLAPAAVDAVQQWRFRPGSLHGKNVTTIFQLTVTFKLNR